jgi:pilus assembly protein Flp/PilA
MDFLTRLISLRQEKGQTMAEYGIILAVIAVIAFAAVALVGGNVSDVFTDIAGKLDL